MPENSNNPDWVSPPGATLKDILEGSHTTVEEFARKINAKPDYVRRIISGKVAITDDLALRITSIVGPSKEFWLRREEQYREALKKRTTR